MTNAPKYKRAIVIWMAIYPTVTAIFYLLGPYLAAYPIPIRTLAITLIAVPFMVYVALPFLSRLLAKWLNVWHLKKKREALLELPF